jgi:RimJ/RimL family protein N-acetyltransferase
MEMMPYHPERDVDAAVPITHIASAMDWPAGAAWTAGLPVLRGASLTLRELRAEDAPSLFALLTTEEVSRFISPPPSSVEAFERFIAWAERQRAEGQYACFAVVPHGETRAVGMFQIRMLDDGGFSAEWGFALGSPYWGSGLFLDGAVMVVTFAFEAMDIERLEARAAVPNGRGNAALRKVGAVRAAVLRGSFERHGERLDQALWTLDRERWSSDAPRPAPAVH